MYNLLGSLHTHSCLDVDARCIAKAVVNKALHQAVKFLELDPGRLFLYKFPRAEDEYTITEKHTHKKEYTPSSSNGSLTDTSSIETPLNDKVYVPRRVDWMAIKEFSMKMATNQIRDYIDGWRLTPATKFVVVLRDHTLEAMNLGTTYFVNVLFSKPTSKCPNPLAVAKIHFNIHVSKRLPKHYPIMVTYRFEGYKSVFYALGPKVVRSADFQRYFIDAILHTKLTFYADIFVCLHAAKLNREEPESEDTSSDWSTEDSIDMRR